VICYAFGKMKEFEATMGEDFRPAAYWRRCWRRGRDFRIFEGAREAGRESKIRDLRQGLARFSPRLAARAVRAQRDFFSA
jgi:hypothetical protein